MAFLTEKSRTIYASSAALAILFFGEAFACPGNTRFRVSFMGVDHGVKMGEMFGFFVLPKVFRAWGLCAGAERGRVGHERIPT